MRCCTYLAIEHTLAMVNQNPGHLDVESPNQLADALRVRMQACIAHRYVGHAHRRPHAFDAEPPDGAQLGKRAMQRVPQVAQLHAGTAHPRERDE